LGSTAFCADDPVTPFKLGTFRYAGREFLGLVLEDTGVVDIAKANTAYEKKHHDSPKVRPPAEMKELIARYEADVGPRVRQIAKGSAQIQSAPYVYAIGSVNVLPPVQPIVILNTGANYPEHARGIVEQAARAAQANGDPAGRPTNNNTPPPPAVSKPGLW